MSGLRRLLLRFYHLVRPGAGEAELARELRAHLTLLEDEYEIRGLGPEAARLAARRALGSVELVKERHRAARSVRWLDHLCRDVGYASRTLRRSPGLTTVAILTLALGIGANTAIFSVVDSLLMRELPVAEPQRLVTVSSDGAVNMGFRGGLGWSYPMWDAFRQRAKVFDGAFAWVTSRLNLSESGDEQPADGIYATGDFFKTLGVPALLGRTFTSADDVRGGGPDGPVVVISYGLWQGRFGSDPTIVGRRMAIDRVPFTIVGVTPPEFFGVDVGQSFDVALPFTSQTLIDGSHSMLDDTQRLLLAVMLRLRQGQSADAANAALRAMQPQILAVMGRRVPSFLKEPFAVVAAATGTADRLRQQYGGSLKLLSLLVALVLFIACVNIANLLLARGTERRHEFSVRLALGASRWRLGQLLLVESALLTVVGATMALVVANWGSQALVAQLSAAGHQIALHPSLDWRVMGFTALVSAATIVLFGMAPAVRAARVAPIDALKEHGRDALGSVRSSFSNVFVTGQVAVSLIVVIAAGLLLQTFARLGSVSLGFDGQRVLLVDVDTADKGVDPASRDSLNQRLLAVVASVPGVAAAAGSLYTPVGGAAGLTRDAHGRALEPDHVVANAVTPGWFAVYGIPVHAGRDVTDRDGPGAPLVMIVNEAFVQRFSRGRSALGMTFDESISPRVKNRTVIGVVGNVVYGSRRDPAPPTVYLPLQQATGVMPPGATMVISARATADAASLAHGVGAALRTMDRDLTFSFSLLADRVGGSIARERVQAILSTLFGGVALLLAGLGLYGVTSYLVSRRQNEFGIRTALGAGRGDVMWLAWRQSLIGTVLGIACGVAGAAAAGRFMSTMLFDLSPLDPATFTAASLIFVVVAAAASYMPARRATSVDPAVALREL